MIARIRHVNPILRIDANAFRAIEFPRASARPANDLKQHHLAPRSASLRPGVFL